jgi:AmmeMemoRadiSam system protein B
LVRNPVVAGQFYPAAAPALRAMISTMVDERAEKAEVIGLVSPHAGYAYSGLVAGAVISRIKPGDTFIVMGPNHTGAGKPFSIMIRDNWRTPLGDVRIDIELANRLLKSSKYLEEDENAHASEHSIEVQLPFLQYFKPDIKLVPIVLSYAVIDVYRDIGKTIARAVRESRNKVVILASSDMTHYEPQSSAQRKDAEAIEAIVALDENMLMDRISESGISMCGYAPVTALIVAAKILGATKGELVKYQTSGDTGGDKTSVVGYAGIIIEGGGD